MIEKKVQLLVSPPILPFLRCKRFTPFISPFFPLFQSTTILWIPVVCGISLLLTSRRWTYPISLPCRGRLAVLPPIGPPSPITTATVHLYLYAAHPDRTTAATCPLHHCCCCHHPLQLCHFCLHLPLWHLPTPNATATSAVHQLRLCPSIAPLSITPPPFISCWGPSATVQLHHLSGCLWVGSGKKKGWRSWQRLACQWQEINKVKKHDRGHRSWWIHQRISWFRLLVTVAETRLCSWQAMAQATRGAVTADDRWQWCLPPTRNGNINETKKRWWQWDKKRRQRC